MPLKKNQMGSWNFTGNLDTQTFHNDHLSSMAKPVPTQGRGVDSWLDPEEAQLRNPPGSPHKPQESWEQTDGLELQDF